jgi:small subunit ribosomal protein S6
MSFQLQKSQKMRAYEAVVIMHPEATDEEQKELFKKNKSIVESFKGEVYSVETWGKRSLSNPIAKNKLGNYFYTTFKASPEVVLELERTMKINDKVLRFLNVKLEDATDLKKHLEAFHETLADSEKRRKEFEEKASKKRAMFRKPG